VSPDVLLVVPWNALVTLSTCWCGSPMPFFRHSLSSRSSAAICSSSPAQRSCHSRISLTNTSALAALASAFLCLSASVRFLSLVSRGFAAIPSPHAVFYAVSSCVALSATPAPGGFPSGGPPAASSSAARLSSCCSAGGALAPLFCVLSILSSAALLSRCRCASLPTQTLVLRHAVKTAELERSVAGVPAPFFGTGDQSDPKRPVPACSSTPIFLPQECCERRSFLPACTPAGSQ
jgi:hypothetical protein